MLVTNETVFRRRVAQAFRNHKKRAAKDHLELSYTKEELLAKASRAGACPFCKVLLTDSNLSFDHRMPMARRTDCYTWTLGNLVPCCLRCNQAKSILDYDEFAALMEVVLRMSPQAQTSVLSRLRAGGARIFGRK